VTCSVCIATFRRPAQLAGCLEALARQTLPPDEVVISDAGQDPETSTVIARCRSVRSWVVRHCPTDRRALPWQRRWAFEHSTGSVVMFLDDDVRLMPGALALINRAYREAPDAAGVGFPISYDGPSGASDSAGLRARWLGVAGHRKGGVTPGGITVELPADGTGDVLEVDWLSGGAMSFRRVVLEAIGPLPYLYHLYDQRIGKAEDSVLSRRACALGRLLLIPGRHAVHPPLGEAARTANPQDGFRRGLLETWGRAHVLRWVAPDPRRASEAWLRLASLEVARAVAGVLREPGRLPHWQRIAGHIVGIGRTIRYWHAIPPHPSHPAPADR
jgi:glycosyltransferase involved in cell wall biosynthesis